MSAQEIKANFAEGKVITPPEPEPLRREIPPSEPYPISALGPILSDAANRIMDVIQAPDALCGQSVLAAASLAVQPYANVEIDGRQRPLSGFFVTIGESGERKSGVDEQALWEHRKYEEELYQKYQDDFIRYENDITAHQKTKDEVLKKEKTFEGKRKALEELGDEPQAPSHPMFITEEPTYEGLIKLLMVSRPSVGIFSDEGGRMIGGHGMSEDNRLKTAAGLSGLWDGKPISRTRAGDGSSLLYGRRVSMHLMVQPMVAEKLLGDSLLASQGLLSRILVAYPATTCGTRSYKAVDLWRDSAMQCYAALMKSILRTPLPIDKTGALQPRNLPLSPDGKQLWVKFHDSIEEQLSPKGNLYPIRGFANKVPEHCLRLAGVLTLVADINAHQIDISHIEDGIKLVEFYISEALRLFNSSLTNPDILKAEKLLEWLKNEKITVLYPRMIYRLGPNEIRDKATAKQIIKILVDHGWLFPLTKEELRKSIDGSIRKEAWRF